MKYLKPFCLLCKTLAFLYITSSSFLNGAVVVSNLGNTFDIVLQANNIDYLAQKITINSVDQDINSVTVNGSKGSFTTNVTLEVQTDSGGFPSGISVGSFDASGIPDDEVHHTVVLPVNAPFTLNASTDYWIVMSANEPQVSWRSTLDLSSTGPGSTGEGAFSNNSGTTWAYLTGPDRNLIISLDATPIPEPQTYAAILACAFLAYAFFKRKSHINKKLCAS